MDFLIVTGMSGAGKSSAVNVLEDLGYYCVDNIPPALISKFSELCLQSKERISRVALVMDSRGGDMFDALPGSLRELSERGERYQVLFLDCADETIVTRYKETRRKHPLCDRGCATIEEAIRTERALLQPARHAADFRIDTTLMSAAQLRDKVRDIFAPEEDAGILVNCMSFGFKYGLPGDADLVFDVRCLPNPYYIPELRPLTGEQEAVEEYVMRWPDAKEMLQKLCGMLEYLLPLYVTEGRGQLVIAVGCTGGQHRSVVFARKIGAYLTAQGYRVVCSHRDKQKSKA